MEHEIVTILGLFNIGMLGIFICAVNARKARLMAAKVAHWLDIRAANSAQRQLDRAKFREIVRGGSVK